MRLLVYVVGLDRAYASRAGDRSEIRGLGALRQVLEAGGLVRIVWREIVVDSDFPRVGVPLNIILWLTASILIPIFWPFVTNP